MERVTVNRRELLTKLEQNRKVHRAVFLAAQKGYRKAVVKELDTMLKDARAGKPIRRSITLPIPQDHTEDYDAAIEMLKMSIDDTISIDAAHFAMYVRDQWGWKAMVVASNSHYLAGSAPAGAMELGYTAHDN